MGSHWNYTEFPEFSTKINNSCLKKTVHAKSIEKAKKRNMIKEVMKCYAAFGKLTDRIASVYVIESET